MRLSKSHRVAVARAVREIKPRYNFRQTRGTSVNPSRWPYRRWGISDSSVINPGGSRLDISLNLMVWVSLSFSLSGRFFFSRSVNRNRMMLVLTSLVQFLWTVSPDGSAQLEFTLDQKIRGFRLSRTQTERTIRSARFRIGRITHCDLFVSRNVSVTGNLLNFSNSFNARTAEVSTRLDTIYSLRLRTVGHYRSDKNLYPNGVWWNNLQ